MAVDFLFKITGAAAQKIPMQVLHCWATGEYRRIGYLGVGIGRCPKPRDLWIAVFMLMSAFMSLQADMCVMKKEVHPYMSTSHSMSCIATDLGPDFTS
jgi:hypothetical protein